MQFIDKQNDFPFALSDFFQNSFQTFLEFTTVFCTGYQCTHIQSKNRFIFQTFRYIATDDSLCQSFYGCRFTYTWFTDQYRIVFCLSGKNTNHISNLAVTADDRIQLLISRTLYQILAVFFQCIVSCFRIIRSNSLVSSYSAQRL